jgi:DNA topoisomerase VI subunit A
MPPPKKARKGTAEATPNTTPAEMPPPKKARKGTAEAAPNTTPTGPAEIEAKEAVAPAEIEAKEKNTFVVDMTLDDQLDEQALFKTLFFEYVDRDTALLRISLTSLLLEDALAQDTHAEGIPVLNWDAVEKIRKEGTKSGESFTYQELEEEVKKQLKENPKEMLRSQQKLYFTRKVVDRIVDVLDKIGALCKSKDGEMMTYTAFRYAYFTHLSRSCVRSATKHVRTLLGVELYSVRLYGAPRGMAMGDFTIESKDGMTKIVPAKSYSHEGAVAIGRDVLAPVEDQQWEYKIDFGTKITSILIVESRSIFEYLRMADFHTKNNAIVVCGSGYSDYATQLFVRQIVKQSETIYGKEGVPVYGAVDCNPHGMLILNGYEGTLGRRVNWIGTWPSDVLPYVDHESVLDNQQELTDRDRAILDNSITKFICDANRHSEVEQMKKTGKKYEWEILEGVEKGLGVKLLAKRMRGAVQKAAQIAAKATEASSWLGKTVAIKTEKE